MNREATVGAAALLLVLLVPCPAGAQGVLETLVLNGSTAERINILIVAEGYTAQEQTKFRDDAMRLLETVLSTPPYNEYTTHFNGFALFVASNESGSTHSYLGIYRDTIFESFYNCGNIRRLICQQWEGQARLLDMMWDYLPEADITLLLVNDPTYGGAGSTVAIASVHQASAEIAIHELGHSFAFLADEYGGTSGGWESINATAETRRGHIRWNHWIEPSTPVPTPSTFTTAVGLFEGAVYSDRGWYRPQHSCKMRSLGAPFCAVCYEHHVAAIYRRISPLAGRYPASSTVAADDVLEFRIETLVPPEHLSVTWWVAGEVHYTTGTALTLNTADLPFGETEVSARVRDTNGRVRDPEVVALLEDTTEWTVIRSSVSTDPMAAWEDVLLAQNYPNPFRESTTFSFRVTSPGHVRLVIYDVLGREVETVFEGPVAAGYETVPYLTSLPPGRYAYTLYGLGSAQSRTLTVLR